MRALGAPGVLKGWPGESLLGTDPSFQLKTAVYFWQQNFYFSFFLVWGDECVINTDNFAETSGCTFWQCDEAIALCKSCAADSLGRSHDLLLTSRWIRRRRRRSWGSRAAPLGRVGQYCLGRTLRGGNHASCNLAGCTNVSFVSTRQGDSAVPIASETR